MHDGDDLGTGKAIKSGATRGLMLAEKALSGSSARVPLNQIRNFLLLQHATALGAVVHATPLIAALKRAVPGCRIVVAASGMAVEIFRNNPGVETVLLTPSPFKDLWGAAKALRSTNPLHGEAFATITSVANERTRVTLQAMLAGAGNRVGFALTPELYRAPLQLNREISLIVNNLRIVEALGHAPIHGDIEPQVFFSEHDYEFARRTLSDVAVQPGQPVAVFVTQTSVTQRKSWRPQRFRETAQYLHSQHGAQILFVGTASEAAAIDAIRDGLPFRTTSVAGSTSLTQLSALLSLCNVGLTLDTGTMHLGRAVSLPMVIVAPAWSPPIEWLPLGNPRFRILKNRDLPVATHDYIIDEVSVDEVTEALADLLRLYPRPA